MTALFPNLIEQLEDEGLNPERIQRVMTLKVRGGKRHLMGGGINPEDIWWLMPLCRQLPGALKRHCQLSAPAEITCRTCIRKAIKKAVACAKKEAFDLNEPGSIEILSDLLLDRGRKIDMVHRRLIQLYPTFSDIIKPARKKEPR